MTITVFTPGLRAELAREANVVRPSRRPRGAPVVPVALVCECGHSLDEHHARPVRAPVAAGEFLVTFRWWCNVLGCSCADWPSLRAREPSE